MIQQNTAHDTGRDAKKMGAVLPAHFFLVYQPDVGFINQRGGLQSVAGVFSTHVIPGNAA
jgi:hypothetical protein